MRTFTISDFLTEAQVEKCVLLETADLIAEHVILPNIDTINQKLGQENDPAYLAYCVEYAVAFCSQARGIHGSKLVQ